MLRPFVLRRERRPCAPVSRRRYREQMRVAGGKERRRLRSLAPSWVARNFPKFANSAVLEALQEQGPQEVFRMSPLLTKLVTFWSLLAFFMTGLPVRAATQIWSTRAT